MKVSDLAPYPSRTGRVLLAAALLSATISVAQTRQPVIRVESAPGGNGVEGGALRGEVSFANAPANFHAFRSAGVAGGGEVEALTLRFSAATRLTKIESGKEFHVEPGGSCGEGNSYAADTTCTLMVRFTPQGPGRRLGHVKIEHTASATPFAFGIGGYGYAPAISFIPSQITTVAGTYPSNAGLLNGAQNLAVDGGDTLYVADTGNNLVRMIDSSGAITTLASGFSAPWGITVDTFGEVYFSRPAANAIHEVYDYGPVVQVNGSGTSACPAATPCTLSSHTTTKPGEMSMDPYNHMFFTEQSSGGALSTVQPVPANLIFLYDPFPYQTVTQGPAAMDASDNIYSFWTTSGNCEIVQQSLYNAENNNVSFNKVAGGHICGFAGDGGLAGNAEIGASIGQIAFDTAGNMYFTDRANQRVRRIDYSTGIINTIAGTGTAGYGGDGTPAVSATLSSPTGLAVDSQGQVYVISNTTTTGTAQVIRKIGATGMLSFGNQSKATASAAKTVTVSNTGNSTMQLASYVITGTNASEFTLDPVTTSCLLTAGSTLAPGQSCKLGFIFKPTATGTRSAKLVLLNNTVTGSNTVLLGGTGVLPTPTLTITSPASGATFTAGSSITFTATVTYTSAPTPTGTVKFTLDGTVINNAVALSSGTATFNAVVSGVGSHTLSVQYSGDGNYNAAGPATRTFAVTAPAVKKASTTKLTATTPTAACKSVPFTATVTGADAVKPTGTVTLKEGTKVLTTATLSQGAAKLQLSSMTAGTHSVTATYSGDSTHAASTSAVFKETVTSTGACMTVHPMPVMPIVPRGGITLAGGVANAAN